MARSVGQGGRAAGRRRTGGSDKGKTRTPGGEDARCAQCGEGWMAALAAGVELDRRLICMQPQRALAWVEGGEDVVERARVGAGSGRER